MRVFVVHILEEFVKDKSDHDGKHKEQNRINQNSHRIGVRALESDHKSEYDDTDDVIDDRCAQYGRSDMPL